jgi:hypothetical protein
LAARFTRLEIDPLALRTVRQFRCTCAADAVAGPAQFRSATRVRPDSALRSAADVEYQVERYWSRPARVGIVPNRAHHPSGTRRRFRTCGTVDRRPLRLSWRAFPPQRGSLAPSAPPPWPSGSKARHDHQQTFLVTTLVLDRARLRWPVIFGREIIAVKIAVTAGT